MRGLLITLDDGDGQAILQAFDGGRQERGLA